MAKDSFITTIPIIQAQKSTIDSLKTNNYKSIKILSDIKISLNSLNSVWTAAKMNSVVLLTF